MLQIWHTVRGVIAGAVAFVACPCHLPITLPLLITLTAGTTVGVWLEQNTVTIASISTVIFIGGTILAFKWITKTLKKARQESAFDTSQNISHEVPTI